MEPRRGLLFEMSVSPRLGTMEDADWRWESLIGSEPVMIHESRFIADVMLGKLTKWLRVTGVDVVYDPVFTEVRLLACAEGEGRIIITRDRRMMSRRGTLQRFYVESDYYFEQLRQIVRTFRLERSLRVFSRCLQCNTALEPVAKTLVGDRVPEYVLASQTAFKQCAKCHRFYWGGTHRDNMLRQLQVMLSGLLSVPLETSH